MASAFFPPFILSGGIFCNLKGEIANAGLTSGKTELQFTHI